MSHTITLQEYIHLLTQEKYATIVSNQLLYAALTIMVWDSILTLDQEIERVWRRKFSLGSYLYVISRYGTTASLFVSCFGSLVKVGKSCIKYEIASVIVSISSTHAFFGLIIARTYAISGNRKLALILLLPIELARFVNNIVSIPTVMLICLKDDNLPSGLLRAFQIEGDIQAALNIATQTISFAIIVYHTFGTWRTFRKSSKLKSLVVLVFEQGVYEFGLMAVLVITINVLIHTLPGDVQQFADAAPINISLPTILLSRFCLALRQRNAPVIREVETKYTTQASWKSSQVRLIAEFGEQTYMSATTTHTSRLSSSSRLGGESIPLSTYEPVLVRDHRHDIHVEDEDEELADEAEVDVTTPLRHNEE